MVKEWNGRRREGKELMQTKQRRDGANVYIKWCLTPLPNYKFLVEKLKTKNDEMKRFRFSAD